MRSKEIFRKKGQGTKVHCLTNPVSMQDMANLLLAAGGSAVMALDCEEVQEITELSQATLLNLGVPDRSRLEACILAGRRANEMGHPVVLDPVGAGASRFRREGIRQLLAQVRINLIRCNQEEARAVLEVAGGKASEELQSRSSGGVESILSLNAEQQTGMAEQLALACGCTVLVSGPQDVVSDGSRSEILTGGDGRICRITGGGCLLSALCAFFCGAGQEPFTAAVQAGQIWKEAARRAGEAADQIQGGIGSFHTFLFDEMEDLCMKGEGI